MPQYISSPKRTLELLSRYGIKLKKSLGQNYMIDTNSIKKIVSLAGIKKGESILEIGPGIGSLTEILLESGAGRLICIEIDKKVSGAFKDLFKQEIEKNRIVIIVNDAMCIDYGDLCHKYGIKKMISNLPYKVAAPLMLVIMSHAPEVEELWVTLQKDVADRVLARTGDKNYSSYTVKSNLLAEYRSCFKLSRNCFIPRPFIDSVVLGAVRKGLPQGFNNEYIGDFFDLVNSSFLHRRKKLINSLTLNARYKTMSDKIVSLLRDLGKDPGVRAEDLSLEDYIYIFRNIR